MNGVTSKLLIAAVFALQAEQGLAQQPGSAAYNSVYLPAHGVGDTRRPAEERWGALALGKKDAVGWTLDGTSEEDAAGTALDACRASGDGCRVMLTFVNECAEPYEIRMGEGQQEPPFAPQAGAWPVW